MPDENPSYLIISFLSVFTCEDAKLQKNIPTAKKRDNHPFVSIPDGRVVCTTIISLFYRFRYRAIQRVRVKVATPSHVGTAACVFSPVQLEIVVADEQIRHGLRRCSRKFGK